jgi:hypothetical protein
MGAAAGLLAMPTGYAVFDPGLYHQPALVRLDAANADHARALPAGAAGGGGSGAACRAVPGLEDGAHGDSEREVGIRLVVFLSLAIIEKDVNRSFSGLIKYVFMLKYD